jgi:Sulfotransferase family
MFIMRLRKERGSHTSLRPARCLARALKTCLLMLVLVYGVIVLSIGGKIQIHMVRLFESSLSLRVLQLKKLKKRKSFSNKSNATTLSQYPYGGAFVHTGKTGGSTISVLLRNGCHSFMPHPCRTNITNESAASKLVKSYYHVPDFGSLRESNHSFYIITSRDPFDRTISAFVYDHVKNRYARNETISTWKQPKYEEAYQCFPTIQRYVEYLGEDPFTFDYPHKRNWVTAESCSDLAKAALHSRVKLYNHLYFSFRLILTYTPRLHKQTLYTIRQEYLWDDWKTLNIELGQVVPVRIPKNGSTRLRNVTLLEVEKKLPVTRELSIAGRKLLCKALRHEYRAYYYLLTHANNLSDEDIQQSIERTKYNCPNLDLPYSTYVRVE